MAHTTYTVDGVTLLDEYLSDYQQQAGPSLDALIRAAKTEPQPWSNYVVAEIMFAVIRDQPIHIAVATSSHGWAMNVNHPRQ